MLVKHLLNTEKKLHYFPTYKTYFAFYYSIFSLVKLMTLYHEPHPFKFFWFGQHFWTSFEKTTFNVSFLLPFALGFGLNMAKKPQL